MSARIANEVPTLWIPDIIIDPGEFECSRVDQGMMARHVNQEDGMTVGHTV